MKCCFARKQTNKKAEEQEDAEAAEKECISEKQSTANE